jgi:anti-anti-sigma factor
MEILVSQEQERVPVTIFRLVGRINLGNVDELVKAARQAFDGGARDLLIDIGEVPTITSAGIRALTEIYKLFNPFSLPKSPHVKLLGPTEEVRRVLNMVGFDAFIDIFETRSEAMAAF